MIRITMSDQPLTQWQRLLQNQGNWEGSFTRLSPLGQIEDDVPSLVKIEGCNQDQQVRLTLQHFSPQTGAVQRSNVLEFSTLNRSILFFEDGAFSQGSMQFAPLAEFGAEFGFLQGDRRLRLVQMFGTDNSLANLTLIRERLAETAARESAPLTVEALLGTWQGEAMTLYPDWRSPDRYTTQLSIQQQGDRLQQHLTANGWELASTAQIAGDRLLFDQGNCPMQVLLLPGGASSNTPLTIPKGQPFFLEAGWLIQAGLRQRMIRRYDDKGGWVSLTLVTEQKI